MSENQTPETTQTTEVPTQTVPVQKNDWNDQTFRKDYWKKYNASYYEKRKELLKNKVMCKCGKQFNMSSYNRHMESKYHKMHILPESEQLEILKTLFRNQSINV